MRFDQLLESKGDQEKALDKVDTNYMFRCLERLSHPQQFVDSIKVLHQETYSQVQNNGHMSEEFLLESGVRQGYPLSPPFYCVQNDVFSYDILKHKEIQGFNIPFNNNYEHMKYLNIEACIWQMEECAKTQSQRNLSLKGKTIVTNTSILSKLWFIAKLFPI